MKRRQLPTPHPSSAGRPSDTPSSETAIVELLASLFGGARSGRVASVGIGDDAAVLRARSGPLVWTIDVSVEGVHFDRRWLSPCEIGARAFHAALSDLAAMGAAPVAALSSLVVPASVSAPDLAALARGQAAAARELRCPIVGGNLSRGAALSVTTTALGATKAPILRSGASPGDDLWLVGDVGLAAAGLEWLKSGNKGGRKSPSVLACLSAWKNSRALVREGVSLAGRAHAAIDVSDGLAGDALHLARSSRVRVVIERARLARALRPELFATARALERSALDFALYGGEDYALLATGSPDRKPRIARRIGRVSVGSGVVFERENGECEPLGGGFDHFRRRT